MTGNVLPDAESKAESSGSFGRRAVVGAIVRKDVLLQHPVRVAPRGLEKDGMKGQRLFGLGAYLPGRQPFVQVDAKPRGLDGGISARCIDQLEHELLKLGGIAMVVAHLLGRCG